MTFSTTDIFDLFMVHEDGYTNLLKFLFDNNQHFKTQFSRMLFPGVEVSNLVFQTRSAFLHQVKTEDKRIDSKKVVPDIILYDKNHFCIIEVKVYASEGKDQTQRYYDAREIIKHALGVENHSIDKYYFLSLDEECPLSSDQFCHLSWRRVGDCLPPNHTDPKWTFILEQFADRIRSINGEEIKKDAPWNDAIAVSKWGGAINFLNALKLHEAFQKCFRYSKWDEFMKAENEYLYSVQIIPQKDWLGYSIECVENGNASPEKCYSVHYEFSWDPYTKRLIYRLDYELNPYYSKHEIMNLTKIGTPKKLAIEKSNEARQIIARNCKKFWKSETGTYNAKIGKDLLKLISAEMTVDDSLTVGDVLKRLSGFIDDSMVFVNQVLLPAIESYSTD